LNVRIKDAEGPLMPSSTSPGSPQLFYTQASPYARICRMALREGGLIAKVGEVTTTVRDPSSTLLSFSPVGRVPALALGDGTTLTETTLILGWFDKNGCQPAMLPDDAAGVGAYARVLGLLDGVAVWNRELRRPEAERSPSVLTLEVARANRIADALEHDVASGGYAAVDAAFLALATVLGYAERRHTVWKWRESRPSLAQWFARAEQRASFCETLPPLGTI
jgi:glutathione S-transferase